MDKSFSFLSAIVVAIFTALEAVREFFSRPEIALAVKGVCIMGVLAVVVGAVGGIESGSLLFLEALIRVLGAVAVACVIFKAIGE
jgi:hypothetical protein